MARFPALGMGMVNIPVSRSTWSHLSENCSFRRNPVSMAKATIPQSVPVIRFSTADNSPSLRNRVRRSSGKNLIEETGFLRELPVFDCHHQNMTQEGEMPVNGAVAPSFNFSVIALLQFHSADLHLSL